MAARDVWPKVFVVLDGSTDSSVSAIRDLAASHEGIEVMELPVNSGKGGAVLAAMRHLRERGTTHVLVMDSDGQHPASHIGEFMELSQKNPGSMILGVPVFGPDAPPERVHGRKVGNSFAWLETFGGVQDSLFGFRVYPIAESLEVLSQTSWGRRFDFDTQLAVRLCWRGIRPINRPVPVFYPPKEGGGVTHFSYVRDNLLLVAAHTRLCFQLIPRLITVWKLRNQWKSQPAVC